MSSLVLAVSVLVAQLYEPGTVLGDPDTIKIVVSPLRVAEQEAGITVLDEERAGRLAVKRYTLDGFFVDSRPYSSADDRLFAGSWRAPDRSLTDRLDVGGETFAGWKATASGPDGTTWLVYSHQAGDAGGLGIIGIDEASGAVRARGFGPSASDYEVSSARWWWFLRDRELPFFLHVGPRYLYIVAQEMVWQYDHQARFVRCIGTEPGSEFKEPYGIAVAENGSLFITDFRLGRVWEYNPAQRDRMVPVPASACIEPESPTFITASGRNTFRVTDIAAPAVKTVRNGRLACAFAPQDVGPGPGGTDFRIAVRGRLLVLHEYLRDRIIVYDTLGTFIRVHESDPEAGLDGPRVAGIDNEGNCYGFASGRWFRFSPDKADTTWLSLPDSALGWELDWVRTYHIGSTLYVLGRRPRQGDSPACCLFVFENDRLDHVMADDWFRGGLEGYISDFCVDPSGGFWFVDIGDRVVREYRPPR